MSNTLDFFLWSLMNSLSQEPPIGSLRAARDGSKGTWLGGGGVKANLTNSRRSMLRFDRLESVNVEVWPARVGQCWGLTDSGRSMLRFDRLESVSVEVWLTQVGRCWGLTGSSRSMLRFDQLESVNVEVWPTWVGQCWGLINSNSFIKQNISVGHFRWSNSVRVWPTQSGFDQLSQLPWSHPCEPPLAHELCNEDHWARLMIDIPSVWTHFPLTELWPTKMVSQARILLFYVWEFSI